MRVLPGLVCLMVAVASAAIAETQPDVLDAHAERAISGVTLALADGRILRLEGIEEPFAGTKKWRNEAQQELQNLTIDHKLVLRHVEVDRYGRLVAQAYVSDAAGHETWLQDEMLKRGLAFVYPPAGSEARLQDMLALETAARRAKAGIWADDVYADRATDEVANQYGHFVFASGVVLDASRVKSMIYIHFGEDWRRNLTVAIAAHDLRAFRDAHMDPLDLKGKTLHVRGWIERDIGPTIVVTDPGQIEIQTAH